MKQKSEIESLMLLREAAQQESENAKESSNRKLLENCLDDINTRFTGAVSELSGRNISDSQTKIILDFYQKQKDECFRKYPQD